ncbi:hypothetical protein DNK59_22465 [Pseudomonas sp. TKO26]|nr:hypothetical protein DNK62_22465 [Pseudomonas sp. TKO30]PYY83740.1 hypothetical protein DNK61_21840 [Pseudomonas sp. TKO29]PYY85697.1 hypothetical protein DNK59_22465 [Pseudomonas sp. TKO26]PYY97989.1 hypothetical protein DNK60_23315 [Pseudomonas sp. TKO14]
MPPLGRLGRGLKIKIKSQARLRAVRRSRLAGEEARKTCVALADAFAGKPAPTEGGRGRKAKVGSGSGSCS